jgi:hypothetical protein
MGTRMKDKKRTETSQQDFSDQGYVMHQEVEQEVMQCGND